VNERGQYGTPLYGGSLYSSSPWGGAPDETSSGWPYRGPQAFHGHEAPTFGRGGSWPPRRGAPLGRGGLSVEGNDRGSYGGQSRVAGPGSNAACFAAMRRAVHAVFNLYNHVRAPYYVYTEANGIVDAVPAQSDPEAFGHAALYDHMPGEIYVAVFSVEDTAWPDPMHQTYRAARPERVAVAGRGQYGSASVGAGSLIPHTPGETEDELDQLDGEIMQFGQEVIAKRQASTADLLASSPELQRLRAEENAASAYVEALPPSGQIGSLAWQARVLAVKKANAASEKRVDAEHRLTVKPPLLEWVRTTWQPFVDTWITWRSEKKDHLWQMLPGSGTWDHIQDERKKFLDIRSNAPFKSTGPAPKDPDHDPSITGFLGDLAKFAKWGLIGILGIAGVVALSSVVHNMKKGEDPAEKYVGMLRQRRERAPRSPLPRASARRALPPPAEEIEVVE
jgi:hypothetical protein